MAAGAVEVRCIPSAPAGGASSWEGGDGGSVKGVVGVEGADQPSLPGVLGWEPGSRRIVMWTLRVPSSTRFLKTARRT